MTLGGLPSTGLAVRAWQSAPVLTPSDHTCRTGRCDVCMITAMAPRGHCSSSRAWQGLMPTVLRNSICEQCAAPLRPCCSLSRPSPTPCQQSRLRALKPALSSETAPTRSCSDPRGGRDPCKCPSNHPNNCPCRAGATFAKWRAVIRIDTAKGLPTPAAVERNVEDLARYAYACQACGLVPIVEPEILSAGNHTLETAAAVHERVLWALFAALHRNSVNFEALLLKPAMVTPGAHSLLCTISCKR